MIAQIYVSKQSYASSRSQNIVFIKSFVIQKWNTKLKYSTTFLLFLYSVVKEVEHKHKLVYDAIGIFN